MKTPARFVSALLCAAAFSTLRAQTVDYAVIAKGSEWLQTSAAGAVLDPRNPGPGYGGPFNFHVSVGGLNLAAITPPVVTLAPGSLYPTQNPARHNGGVLAFDAGEQQWNYGSDGGNWGGMTEAERDAAFTAGVYGLSVLGETFSLNFPATSFLPNTPEVTMTGGAWVGGKYVIEANKPLTITTNAFTHFDKNADAVMELSVAGAGYQITQRSENPGGSNFLTISIPANTLVAGKDYSGDIAFHALMDRRGSLSTRLDATTYERSTSFTLAAVPPPQPGAKAVFYGVGDLSGSASFSEVRDATKAGGVIYAVGDSSSRNGSAGGDTGFVWSSTSGMVPLRDIVTSFTSVAAITPTAITPDGAFIASRARAGTNGNQVHAVRVARAGLTNVDLGTLPGFGTSQANAISSDGAVLYGAALYTNSPLVTVRTRAVRFAGGTVTTIPFLNPGDDSSAPADRGASADGSVLVGRSTNGAIVASSPPNGPGIGAGNRAFRYVHGSGISAIPLLPGGTWSGGVALTPNGQLALVRGNSTAAPQGEFYIHNAATGTLTSLGTPNGSRVPGGITGITADGAVIAAPFNVVDNPTNCTYLHNAHGWHDFQTVVERAGVNLAGWDLRGQTIFGLSPDGTLAWGRGLHNGVREGWVVEFEPGYLASYQEPAVFATPEPAIVGAWITGDPGSPEASVAVFFNNGYYMIIEVARPIDAPSGVSGFERGQYTWNPATGAIKFTTLVDTGGDYGFSSVNNVSGQTVFISGDTLTYSDVDGTLTATRITGASPIIGAFGHGNAHNASQVLVFLPNGIYFMAKDGSAGASGQDGIERGTYAWNATTGLLTTNPSTDTNGAWGLSHPAGAITVGFSADLDTLTATDTAGAYSLKRVQPRPTITGPLTAGGTYGQPFSYTIAAFNNARDFDAFPLPAGLAVNHATGLISGVPAATGVFPVTIAASNSGGSDTKQLVITIARAPATVTLGNLTQSYTGTARVVTVTTNPPGVPVSVTYDGSPTPPSAIGSYAVAATVTGPNYVGGASGTLVVSDTTPPVIASLTASSTSLSPANHKLVPITLTAATSDDVAVASVAIVSVTSNEPDDGLGDGDTADDFQITGPMALNLRAERAGNGSGRIYTITVEARDAAGNASTATVLITVPVSQGRGGS